MNQVLKNILVNLLLSLVVILLSVSAAWATHNRAGEIRYRNAPTPNNPYRYEFTIVTYTKIGGESDAADRDSLDVDFGDGSPVRKAPRTNGPGNNGEVIFGTNIKYNEYVITHSYAGPFNYLVSMTDPNRIDHIVNISLGGSVDVPFYIEAVIAYIDPQFYGYNSSPVLYQPPIDYGNVGYPFIHNPNAFDADGDSLYFELIPPKQSGFAPVPLYQYPDQVNPGNNNNISLNSQTGEFIWDAPQREGIYNIAFLIHEYRNGVEIGQLVRDMQIIVEDVNNRPPSLVDLKDTCIIAGETLVIDVSATDPDGSQQITLSAYGGPLSLPDNPAGFSSIPDNGTVHGTFAWQTNCSHIYSQPYTVVIKAEDNFYNSQPPQNGPLPLADLETWLINVVAPPPSELLAIAQPDGVVLTWNTVTPYPCRNNPKFMGYTVWRRIGCDSLAADRCQKGVSGGGYQKIAQGLPTNTYTDLNAAKGLQYTYRVEAVFADAFTESNPPQPLNFAPSIPSSGFCIELPIDAPIITQVSVATTSTANGQIDIAWQNPIAADLDTVLNPPPYRYEIYRAEGLEGNAYTLLQTYNFPTFTAINSISQYTDQTVNLNTQSQPYHYKIAFYTSGALLDEAPAASSVYLAAAPSDNQIALSWTFKVPWLNYEYHIFRQNDSGQWIHIATTTAPNYTDTALQNGKSYCYYVEAYGTYGTSNLPNPLRNLSQQLCATPIDTEAPCAPVLTVVNNCDSANPELPDDNLFTNILTWSNPNSYCADDVVAYNIYFKPPLSSEEQLLLTLQGDANTAYNHMINNSLAGCYSVSAVDSFANESIRSNIVCKENCINYELPNVFTPNGDQQNDLFVPRKSVLVSSISFKVYNRWGNLVFETTNPQIEWNGRDIQSGKLLAEGVYSYVCEVYEINSDGISRIAQTLEGYIHLLAASD